MPFTCGEFVKNSKIPTRPLHGIYFNQDFVKVMFRYLLDCIRIDKTKGTGSIQWDKIKVAFVYDIRQHPDTYEWKDISEVDNMTNDELIFHEYYKPFNVEKN